MTSKTFFAVCGLLMAFLSLGSAAAFAAGEDKKTDGAESVYEMREVSVFEERHYLQTAHGAGPAFRVPASPTRTSKPIPS